MGRSKDTTEPPRKQTNLYEQIDKRLSTQKVFSKVYHPENRGECFYFGRHFKLNLTYPIFHTQGILQPWGEAQRISPHTKKIRLHAVNGTIIQPKNALCAGYYYIARMEKEAASQETR